MVARIGYVLASPPAGKRVTDAFIWPRVTGSDHCPVGIDPNCHHSFGTVGETALRSARRQGVSACFAEKLAVDAVSRSKLVFNA